ncbi:MULTISPECIES: PEP-CTERM sorting domain-containing protein [unclassified Janthinobacterium]|uniref:PEP-CTERM sorting domain-containing protein n=1 Tax=unclassified Janthinobacterium TaxID=2610881 RepID=UPI000346D26A|nr:MULTISPECIES: PEP-CTERM sorting domain-containing protein [unclassified Janthinobacterium]MEC5160653.1 hypothetical protein [Janthinobacterium sp. CG_S6]
MNKYSFVLAASLLSAAACAETITFDDAGADATYVQNGYHGLNWDNFLTFDPLTFGEETNASGFRAGTVSGANVLFNGAGDPASIRGAQGFTLGQAYFTAAWREGLEIHAVASDGVRTYVKDFTVGTLAPTVVSFQWGNVTSVVFASSGGAMSGSNGNGYQFVIDNMTLTSAVPEPGSWVMLLAGLGLLACARRRAA